MSRSKTVRMAYERNAPDYDRHAALEAEVCQRLLERVAFRRADPQVVVDLGCGTGIGAAALKKTFRKAQVIGLDLSPGMLAQGRRRSRLVRPLRFVEADMASLPFTERSVDLVFSNLALPWLERWDRVFEDVSRILNPGGMFLFSMYGAGSMPQRSPAGAGETGSAFPDIMVVGDALTAVGFREPVMDIDFITLDYPDLPALRRELEITGTSLLLEDGFQVHDGLDSAAAGQSPNEDGRIPLGFEIVYGVAFGAPDGQPRRSVDGEIATFSVDSLLKSRNLL